MIWFMEDATRLSAECLLRECSKGTFLIRPAESRSNEFSLSVKDSAEVKHYRIRMNDEGMLFIAKRSTFPNLVQLVEHYKQHCDGLCVKLVASIEHNEGPVRTLQSLSKSHEVNWEIQLKDLHFGTKLGSGQFGEVFRGSWNGNKEVAIKTLKQGTMDKEDFRRESNIMKKLQHKNLVALYGVCIEPLLIVTELAKHGNLLEFFKKAESRLVYKDLIMMGSNVASGMAYLERNGYVHRDLAARNVLVHKERPITCKIGDFGLARKMTQENLYDAHQGAKFPIKWTAPEAATKNVFTTKSDVWSFGILFYEICTKGRTPYAGMSNADVLREVEKGYRMPKLDCIEQKSYDIMSNCWRPEANKRPTFEALQHILDDYYTSNDDANYNEDVR
ncbi:tyrosine-protein kinase Src42A-like [Convolutriloba macropyga]|uniref:tyrosine-protein kinase Src42A-like n=1 Tax=Convolutriloba macropyga TaxID=536237 RepID=UPI003F526CF1